MKKLLTLGLLLSSLTAFADVSNYKTLADEKATFELCQNYADTFNKNMTSNIKPAFDIIRPYLPIPQIEIDNLEYQTNQLVKNYQDRIGEYIQTVHIDTEKFAKDNFIQHRFLLKKTTNGWYASCIFYKPKDKWQLHTFNFYDNPLYFKD